jgi:MYXO-CTERM domain-containing protein
MGLPLVVLTALVSLTLSSTPVRALDTEETPSPGMVLKHHVDGGQDLWVLRIDLCASGVSVRATAEQERGQTVGAFAAAVGAQAAINGDFFALDGSFSTDGPAAHDGTFWGGGRDHDYVAPVSFGSAHVQIPRHDLVGGTPPWAREVVSGHPTLLDDGRVVGSPGDPLCTNRHPRTALGLSADRRTLIALVVDGRRSGAAGFTCDEMAFVLALEGAHDAVALDGGGSSTLVVGGQVKNRPSDGRQRTVGNHLAFFATGTGPALQCPDYVDPVCDGDPHRQRCDGSFITSCEAGAPIAYGDCGFFGAGCSTQGGQAHCVHPFCLHHLEGGEDGSFCIDGTKIGSCTLGRYEEGDCGAFGALCSEAGGTANDAHCVHFLCHTNLDGGENGTFCKDATTLATCTQGTYVEQTCSEGCATSDGGARCGEDPASPPDAGPPADVDGGPDEQGNQDPDGGASGAPDAGPSGDVDAGVVLDRDDADAVPDEDEDDDGRRPLPRALRGGCANSAPHPPAFVGVAALLFLLRRRRR